AEDAGGGVESAFRNRVIGIVATWMIGGVLSIYYELWDLVFAAFDQIAQVPVTILSDLTIVGNAMLNIVDQFAGAYEQLLVEAVEAAGPFGWLAGVFVTTVLIIGFAVVARSAYGVVRFV
ncbi:hypothetical protein, partial [Natronolimnohabitans innermongolicus]